MSKQSEFERGFDKGFEAGLLRGQEFNRNLSEVVYIPLQTYEPKTPWDHTQITCASDTKKVIR